MALAPGTRLGRYEIVSPLGAGGMGEVYRAHDATLKRDVAIKIIPEAFAADADRLRRFEQEALATAALNHPNILAVYDFGTHQGGAFVVAELLEGQTLKEALATGPLPLRKAIDYATQIASGLAAAHEKSIVHRDLKPANLFVTHDGHVKILDFGLARILHDADPAGPENAAAMTAMTAPGVMLGTVGYMAPEQVRGEAVDHRADLFSFGAVFYEMLTGRRAFQRDSVPGTLAAILDAEPPAWSGDGSALSTRMIRLIHRCLEKAPRARLQSARDLSLFLSDEITDTSLTAVSKGQPDRRLVWLVAAALVAAAVLGALVRPWLGARTETTTPSSTVAFTISLPPGDFWGGGHPLAISHDGLRVVYAANHEGVARLYLRDVNSAEVVVLKGTEGGSSPFISPDGLSVAFFANRQLKITSIAGGLPHVRCPAPDPRGGSWGDDDHIVFAPNPQSGLFRMPASGNAPPVQITTVDSSRHETSHRYPQVLRDSTVVLFTIDTVGGAVSVAAQPTRSEAHVILVADGAYPQHVRNQIVYANRVGELFAVPFDASRLKVGTPVALRERPVTRVIGESNFNAAANGTFVYLPFEDPSRSLAIIGREGATRALKAPSQAYSVPRLSSDGQQVALDIRTGTNASDVWLFDIRREQLTPVTSDGNSRNGTWGPGSQMISFGSVRNGQRNVYSQSADGSNSATPLLSSAQVGLGADPVWWSRDGRTLVYRVQDARTKLDVWTLTVGDARGPQPLVNSEANEFALGVSADGRWLAFTSDKSGRREVWVTRVQEPGGATKVSEGGATQAHWAKSGDELFFLQGNRVFSARVTANGALPAVETARPVVAANSSQAFTGVSDFDVFPDGSFLVIKNDEHATDAQPLVVMTNWAAASFSGTKRAGQ